MPLEDAKAVPGAEGASAEAAVEAEAAVHPAEAEAAPPAEERAYPKRLRTPVRIGLRSLKQDRVDEEEEDDEDS